MKMIKKLVVVIAVLSLVMCMCLPVLAEDGSAEFNEDSDSATATQEYSFNEVDRIYKNTERVMITWEIEEVAVSYVSGKVWDASTREWVEGDESDAGVASFDVTNFGAEPIKTSVSFEQAEELQEGTVAAVFTNNDCEVGSVVKADKSVDTSLSHEQKITASVTTDAYKVLDFKVDYKVRLGAFRLHISK